MTLEVKRTGSMFDSGADVLVNPVNCKGVSGAGLAKEFAARYPTATHHYKVASADFVPGRCYRIIDMTYNKGLQTIYYFTTKDDWRNPSQLIWIWSGLLDMARLISAGGQVQSIAVPALGCGRGGLDWDEVWLYLCPLTQIFDHIKWIIYPPQNQTKSDR